MAEGLYLRMARGNIKRNRGMYLPYFIAAVIMSGMYFIITNMVITRSVTNMSYGGTMMAMLTIGLVVMTLFTIGYMLYLNSFLTKRRRREFGLYGILGLEKRHVGRIILWENIIVNVCALALGLLCGAVLGRLVFLGVLKLVDAAPGSVYTVSPMAMLITAAVFGVIFLIATIYNLFSVRLAKPVELLSGSKRGEKKVRLVVLRTILGLVSLGLAYWLAIFSDSGAAALTWFWPAVLLVIFGTWQLFTAGSVFVLGAIKRNKRLYYKPRNFISVSGLIHRMKQNAAGLSNICILSTMVLVTISCCCALYFGQESSAATMYPDDFNVVLFDVGAKNAASVSESAKSGIERVAGETGVTLDELTVYTGRDIYLFTSREDGRFLEYDNIYENASTHPTMVISADEYTRVTGESLSLGENELLLLASDEDVARAGFENTFTLAGVRTDTVFTNGKNSGYNGDLFLVAADEQTAKRVCAWCGDGDDYEGDADVNIVINVSGGKEAQWAFSDALKETMSDSMLAGVNGGYSFQSISDMRRESQSIYGGLLVLGVFFTVLFLTNVVLIMYFKQISEGYEDRERFVILQKVGLGDDEVKKTINRQILLVFFLPLAAALIHVLASANMLVRIISLFGMVDLKLTLICIVAASVIFSIFYIIVYRMTAKAYYSLVKWKH